MASATSTLLKLELPVTGELQDDWGDNQNRITQRIEESIAGITNITTTGAADYTLDDTEFVVTDDATPTAEVHPAMFKATGTLTANQNVIVPTRTGFWWVWNATSGAYNFVVKTSAGTGVTVPSGTVQKVFCDGTNVEAATVPVDTDGNITITTINGAAIDNSIIGASVPAAGTFTNLTATGTTTVTTADINGGAIDGTAIGASVPSTGVFTSLSTTGTATVGTTLTVTGDLIVNGTTITVEATTVEIADNLLLINKNEVGAGVTAGTAGIEVERGSATNYQFMFRESDDAFVIGAIGSLQSVATREDTPTDNAFAFWDTITSKFETSANFTYNGTTYVFNDDIDINSGAIDGTAIGASVPSTAVFTTVQATQGAPVNSIATTSNAYTPVLTDAGKTIEMTSSASMSFTIPTSGTVAYAVGTLMNVVHVGPGALSFAAAGGVTLNSAGALVSSANQYSMFTLYKQATNVWILSGNLA